ncbi:hypothetical protein [Alkalimarinus sediminis]|uniref:Uncharacterized protein n=1 Tax=Alkalimarinus sediminis TaxID=1632866 RepID=A0A9E8HPG9_9ALTE|nr:hypothetical protein [Alkalimarinus sediminis]UZW76353.1 hypothetical protein NNL22_07140 [Alkalimarinus sediminis]
MKLLKGMLLIFIGFTSGVFCSYWYLWPLGDAVRVRVINSSGVDISSMVLSHEDGSVSAGSLSDGEQKVVPIYVIGESSYSISVTLENGVTLKGIGGYVEPGYRVNEIVKAEEIKHDYKSFY